MKKQALIKKILAKLGDERSLLLRAALASRAEATHEQSKADNKYDTRGLEASYLAQGQSRQVAEVELAIERFAALPLREFGPTDGIELGALVEAKTQDDHSFYFIGPRAGGMEITHGKNEILVITPLSPLGQQLMGKKQGTRLKIEIGGVRQQMDLVAVS